MFTDRRPIYVTDSNGNTYQVQWGFFLENTLFRAFEPHNNRIIELAHQELAHRVGNNYVDIIDQVLGSDARVYFGVERIHLRMPGTRYYVERRLTAIHSNLGSPRGFRWSTPRRSTVRQQPRPSTSAPATLTTQQTRRTSARRSRASSSAANVVKSSASKLSATPTSSASTTTATSAGCGGNNVFATHDALQMMPSISAPTLGYPQTGSFMQPGTFGQTSNSESPESFDWEIIPRLVHRASQEWSQASSSSSSSSMPQSPMPQSPSDTPDLKRRKQDHHDDSAITAQSVSEPSFNTATTSYSVPVPVVTPTTTSHPTVEPTIVHITTATDPGPESIAQPPLRQRIAQNPLPARQFIHHRPEDLEYIRASLADYRQRVAALEATSSVIASRGTSVSTGLSTDDVDFQMVDALNAMSISFPSQEQGMNQELFMTPSMRDTSMALNQLPNSDLSSYWVWPMTTHIQPTVAAGTANTHTGINELQLFDDEGQLAWYTNNGVEPMDFYPQQ